MGAANPPPSPAPVGPQDVANNPTTTHTTTTTTTTASASAAESDPPSQRPQQPLPSPGSTNANSTTGKRKRSISPSASIASVHQRSPAKKKPDDSNKPDGGTVITTLEDRASQRLLFMEATMRDLLTVLKPQDPTPSVLRHPIPNGSPSSHGAPPVKRTRISPSSPNTIGEKLLRVAYTSLATLLSDIGAVCRELLTSAGGNEGSNGALINGTPSTGSSTGGLSFVAQVIHFEVLAKQVITRERVRRADLFDFVQDMTDDSVATKPAGDGGKVALTVMGQHGPLFSSLQNPIVVPPASDSAPSSRSTSASASPKSSASTAPTSTAPSPKAEALDRCPIYTPLNESHLPPLISTVKAIPSSSRIFGAGVKKISGKEGRKILTLGEAFPALRGLQPLLPPKPGQPGSASVGLKWGGEIGVGGIRGENPSNDRRDACGDWLSYRNNIPPSHPLLRHEPPRSSAPLPPDVIAAYSSFAPTRDDSASKIPAAVRNRVWWYRVGKQFFTREFADDPFLVQMHNQFDESEVQLQEEVDLDEEFRKAVDNLEPDKEVPIDFRLLDGTNGAEDEPEKGVDPGNKADESIDDAEKVLAEISSLLQNLRSQQYTRLSTVPPNPPPKSATGNSPALALAPSEEEVALYNTIQDRLSHLISKLPPHLVATLDGDPSGDLAVSSKIPVISGPIFKGTLPPDDSHIPAKLSTPQVQGAAIAAMNAAAGLSPVNSAPVAHMSNTPLRPPPPSRPMTNLPNVSVGQYQLPHFNMPPSVTTPHHYPTPYAPVLPPQMSAAQTPPPPPQQQQYQPPPPRVVSPLHHRQQQQQQQQQQPQQQQSTPTPTQQQFHGHSLPQQTYAGSPVYQTPTQPRRAGGVPPVQGLAAVGVGFSSPAYNNTGLRMGVQHTQQSMGGTPRHAGRRR